MVSPLLGRDEGSPPMTWHQLLLMRPRMLLAFATRAHCSHSPGPPALSLESRKDKVEDYEDFSAGAGIQAFHGSKNLSGSKQPEEKQWKFSADWFGRLSSGDFSGNSSKLPGQTRKTLQNDLKPCYRIKGSWTSCSFCASLLSMQMYVRIPACLRDEYVKAYRRNIKITEKSESDSSQT